MQKKYYILIKSIFKKSIVLTRFFKWIDFNHFDSKSIQKSILLQKSNIPNMDTIIDTMW